MKVKRELKRFVRLIVFWLVVLQMVISLLGITIARGGTAAPSSEDHYISTHRANVLKILSVLENKMRDQQLLEKAKDKLFTLSDRQTRLIASLSDRIANEGNTAGADIAFLLITALIVFS